MNSNIILCKGIKLDKEYNNVLSYSTSQMLEVCRSTSHRILELNNYSFIKDSDSIITNFTYSQCLQANYIAFQNPRYDNKWFFAFIDKVIYKSDNATQINFTVDIWSTWFGNWTKKPCYVVREHVNNDSIGANTVNENLSVGEVECINSIKDDGLDNTYGYYIVVASNWSIGSDSNEDSSGGGTGGGNSWGGEGEQQIGCALYNGMIFAENLYFFQAALGQTLSQAVQNLQLFLLQTSNDRHIADIKNIFIVPNFCVQEADLRQNIKTVGGYTCTYYTLSYSSTVPTAEITGTYTTYSTYVPKNNKCYIYPYHYLLASNLNGNTNIYKYENFAIYNQPKFKLSIAIMPGCTGRLYPLQYKGINANVDESIPIGKYPICEWTCDSYINWLTQNSVNIPSQLLSTGISAFTSSNPLAAATTISEGISNLIGNFYGAELMPNISGGNNTADINFLNSYNNVVIYEYKCKDEYLKIIDDYFTRFGYQINRVKEPNIIGRTNWNYLEISSGESVGNGDVPGEYMDIINNICRKGVTIWHNHENIGNFNLSNNIV